MNSNKYKGHVDFDHGRGKIAVTKVVQRMVKLHVSHGQMACVACRPSHSIFLTMPPFNTAKDKPKPPPLPRIPKGTEKYLQKDLAKERSIREARWKDLLRCARLEDDTPLVLMPKLDKTAINLAKVSYTISKKVEILDVFHYLSRRNAGLAYKVSSRTFGPLVGLNIPKTTLNNMLMMEDDLRIAQKVLPDDAKYLVTRKHMKLELVLIQWIESQRSRNVPVSGKMIKKAAEITYTVLADYQEQGDGAVSEMEPSFAASWSWFEGFKKHHGITYCKLHGEAASVDLEAIEPELVNIREICAEYNPEDIYNCDETGMYLKELDTKSYTVIKSSEGAKAARDCRVSILFCISASGSSLALAKKYPALKPLVICNVHSQVI